MQLPHKLLGIAAGVDGRNNLIDLLLNGAIVSRQHTGSKTVAIHFTFFLLSFQYGWILSIITNPVVDVGAFLLRTPYDPGL